MEKKHSYIAIAVVVVLAVVGFIFFGDELSGPRYASAFGSCGGQCSAGNLMGDSCQTDCSKDERPHCTDDPVNCVCVKCTDVPSENYAVSTNCMGGRCTGDGCDADCKRGEIAYCHEDICVCIKCSVEGTNNK